VTLTKTGTTIGGWSYLVLESAYQALRELYQGVTTVRDLGARHGIAVHLRNAIADGLVPGPSILAAGAAVTAKGGHFHVASCQADTADETRRAVREQLHAGADCIKLMASGGLVPVPNNKRSVQYSVAELRAGVEEAHKPAKLVAAHAQAGQAIRSAVEASVDSIEHGVYPTMKQHV
jgi:imidazolonepropionase-like amidohydrolase